MPEKKEPNLGTTTIIITDWVHTFAPQGRKQSAITKGGHNRIGRSGHSCHFQKKTGSLLGLFNGRYGGVIFWKIE